jgi:hypothetical protein
LNHFVGFFNVAAAETGLKVGQGLSSLLEREG